MMHFIQKKRRERLRRRVANGEVDLERLGIKRLTVPRIILDRMPLYTYPILEKEERSVPAKSEIQPIQFKEMAESAPAQIDNRISKTLLAQPTCAICLDEFVPGESLVRELPCYHIFHSECVDTFLRENSSLCPLCKKSSLPAGYCPAILTHAMVRRERTLRRMRERVPNPSDQGSQRNHAWNPANWRIWSREIFSSPRRSSNGTPLGAAGTNVELRNSPERTTTDIPTPIEPTISQEYHTRPEWARQRALEMVGTTLPDSVTAEEFEIDGRRRAKWRRAVSKIWPGVV
jgi:hypothetical protein